MAVRRREKDQGPRLREGPARVGRPRRARGVEPRQAGERALGDAAERALPRLRIVFGGGDRRPREAASARELEELPLQPIRPLGERPGLVSCRRSDRPLVE